MILEILKKYYEKISWKQTLEICIEEFSSLTEGNSTLGL